MQLDPYITTPNGRLVRGSVETLREKKGTDGKVKIGKDGQPMRECYFELAIPKAGEAHWNQTAWGARIWQIGAAAFPTMHQNPAFAWKVIDGDSAVPNRKGKIPNQQANYPGNWIIKVSSGFVPNRYRRAAAGGFEQVVDAGVFKLGHWAQVQLQVQGNGSNETPGIYMNPSQVCWSAFGTEIYVGPDVDAAGFGQAPLPPGASATPVGGAMPALPGAAPAPLIPGLAAPAPLVPVMAPPPPVAAPVPAGLVPVPGAAYTIEQCRAANPPWTDDQIVAAGYATRAPAPLPPAISAPAPAAPIAPAGVVPNPAFAQIPPPAAAGPQLTAAGAALGTYEGFIAQGWTPEAMRAQGYLV